MKNVCLLISMIAVSVSGASAQVTGDFKDVSFNVTATADGRMKFVASGGTGTLKNDSGETIANGSLIDKEGGLSINGRNGASFRFEPRADAFPDNAFSQGMATGFAGVELTQGNRWVLKDANFYFVLDLPDATRPRLVPNLDKSVGRATIITLPTGVTRLWGYTITVEKEKGTVQFARGKIIAASDASYQPGPQAQIPTQGVQAGAKDTTRRVSPVLPFQANGLQVAKGGTFSTDSNGRMVQSTGMSLKSLYLGKLEIPLQSTTVTSDNMIVTREYGNLQLQWDFSTGVYSILVTSEQEQIFKSLCSQGRC